MENTYEPNPTQARLVNLFIRLSVRDQNRYVAYPSPRNKPVRTAPSIVRMQVNELTPPHSKYQ